MAHPFKHAESSARTFGGKAEDYLAIHNWFDVSKSFFTDFRHRALRHHAEGIFLAERIFGVTIVNSDGERVAVRYVGEQHVKEDLGRIPTVQDWLSQITPPTLDVWSTLRGHCRNKRQLKDVWSLRRYQFPGSPFLDRESQVPKDLGSFPDCRPIVSV